MEGLLETALLYDFYGELLTQHQREIFEDYSLSDLSLGEIAQNRGVSRQAVHDIIRRCRRQLEAYEEKLHLVGKFLEIKEALTQIDACAGQLAADPGLSQESAENVLKIRRLAGAITQEL